jgi:hypothetical protein
LSGLGTARRTFAGIALCLAATALSGPPAHAEPSADLSLNGLIRAPVADPLRPGEVQFGYTTLDQSPGLAGSNVYAFGVGLYSWLEVSARLIDEASTPLRPQDLSAGAKLRWSLGEGLPSVAVGVQDLQGNQLLPGYYAVSSWSWRSLRLSGGYGWESALLSGGIAGLDWTPWRWLQLAVEHTATANTAGVRLIAPLWRGTELIGLAAKDFGSQTDSHYGLSLSVPLHSGPHSGSGPGPGPGPDPGGEPVEVVLQPNLVTFVGTDSGTLDVDLALRGRLQVPVVRNTLALVSLVSPSYRTSDFDPHGPFGAQRSRAGIDQAFVQVYATPAPAWHVLTSVGGMRVFGQMAAALLNENVAYWEGGLNLARLNLGVFADPENAFGMAIAEYRRQWPAWHTSIGLAGGQFAGGDTGLRVDLTRFFGDTAVILFVKGSGGGNDAAGGLGISVPLTSRRPGSGSGFVVRGSERWGTSLQSTFGGSSGINRLRPNMLAELRPDRNLRDSFLDDYRAPAGWAE